MNKQLRAWKDLSLLLTGLIILCAFFVSFFYWKNKVNKQPEETHNTLLPEDEKLTSPAPTYSPIIPTSAPEIKSYIDRASVAAQNQNYREAITILDAGIKRYPSDTNLQLTREYYENEAERLNQ